MTYIPTHSVKTPFLLALLITVSFFSCQISAQEKTEAQVKKEAQEKAKAKADAVNEEVGKLEAELGKYQDTAPEAADVMIKLANLYHEHARVFGLIRIGQRFISAHPNHPQHETVMLKLIDGLQVTSRNQDLVIVARQFLARYSKSAKAFEINVRLAETLDQLREWDDAAAAWHQVWNRSKNTQNRSSAVKAVGRYTRSNDRKQITLGAELAEELFAHQQGSKQFAQYAGLKAFHEWRRIQDYAKSNIIGNRLLKSGLPLLPHLKEQLHYLMGENSGALSQHANAAESYRLANSIKPRPFYQTRQIERLHYAQSKAAQMNPVVQDYLRKYPKESNIHYLKGMLAHAYFRDKQPKQGLQLLREVLPHDAYSHGNASAFVRENGSEPAQVADSERVLRSALQQNKKDAWYLRYVLAFDIYRDRMKNEAKTMQMLREMLSQSPGNNSHSWNAISWLLSQEKDENRFRQDVAMLIKSQRTFYHHSNYRTYLPRWAKDARRRKEHKDRGNYVASELQKVTTNPFYKLWPASEHYYTKNAYDIRNQLLAPNMRNQLSPDQLRLALERQGYYYRHYASAKDRNKAAGFYRILTQMDPKNFSYAMSYLQAASDYSPPEVMKEAALNLMKFDPPRHDADIQRRLMVVADRNKDADFAKKALVWILQEQKKFGNESYSASYIGDVLERLELKNEALTIWNNFAKSDPHHSESRECMNRLMTRLETPQKRQLLQQLLRPDTNYHFRYAQWLAHTYWEEKNLNVFDSTLREGIKRKKERPFQSWDLDAGLVETWRTRPEEKFPTPQEQIKLTNVLKELPADYAVGPPAILNLQLTQKDAQPLMQRLLQYQKVTRLCGDNTSSWDRIMPTAQKSLADENYHVAATLLTGMLSNIPDVDANRQKAARDLVAQSYSRMGAVGLTIDENSPMAPLLQAALYLRLGDDNLALQTYLANKPLFKQHKDAVPVDLLLFVCENHISAGGDENHLFVEEVLRGWQIKNNDAKHVNDTMRAKVQLLLAKNFFKAQRFDVARSEYTSLMNQYPESPEATEAEFGIGETFMAQKVYDQAERVFEKLAHDKDPNIVVRAEFLRGVLAFRRGDKDDAKEIFEGVLERVPNIELANQALFNLAQVYGDEERYIEQLSLLQTVGRLGRNSKRTHKPGMSLSIVVQDSDLGISRGHNKIPVLVTTVPGGDSETVYLVSGGAGKGLFRVDLPTSLGQVAKNDHVLQLSGKDVIHCDYPNEFKAEFRHVPLSDVDIRIAADAEFEVASSKIEEQETESFSQELKRETEENQDERVSQGRPANQIKPGNLIYLKVKDADRDLSDEQDTIVVKLEADSGDQVQLTMKETSAHSGIFEGTAETGELPAGALASDTSIEHSPLMAIDQDEKTYWLSEPDGKTPKDLMIDLKDLKRSMGLGISVILTVWKRVRMTSPSTSTTPGNGPMTVSYLSR